MIYNLINTLAEQALDAKLIEQSDKIYAINQVLNQLNLSVFHDVPLEETNDEIPDVLNNIIEYAINKEIIKDIQDEKEILSANIMNCFIARPSVINDNFKKLYVRSPKKATDYFYKLSINSNYIQMDRIKRNIHFKTETTYGMMDITINMSKPEKDPEQIEKEKGLKFKINYPKCVLCIENEGYVGRPSYPARANHRIIHIPLIGEDWYLQYSPYLYYNEHSILLSGRHEPMIIDKKTFKRLLDFIDKFPHYFIGSNADLPIVGGSILGHDHYQAGSYKFPLDNAKDLFSFKLKKFPDISLAILDWPLTTIRMQSDNKKSLVNAAELVLLTWQTYNDEQAQIKAFSGKIPHNTVTPIAKMRDNKFELDIVLRNNRATTEFPDGIFHARADDHHIKRENIGLIEAMGLAVLPARLQEELTEVKNALLGKKSKIATYHEPWVTEIRQQYGNSITTKNVELILEKKLGNKFERILTDAGVLKSQAACRRFIKTLQKLS